MVFCMELCKVVLLQGGAHERNRTFDLLLTKEVLYRLSYVSMLLKNLLKNMLLKNVLLKFCGIS